MEPEVELQFLYAGYITVCLYGEYFKLRTPASYNFTNHTSPV